MDTEKFQQAPSGKLVKAIGGHQAFMPNPLPPPISWTDDLVNALSEADRAVGYLSGLGQILTNPYLLIRPLQRQEAVIASRCEGIKASLTELFAFESTESKSKSLPDEVKEVFNYVNALEYGLQEICSGTPVTLNLIQKIHTQLMKNVHGKWHRSGEFRTTQNWLGEPGCRLDEAIFVPPPPELLPSLLKSWEQFVSSQTTLPPLAKLALTYYQFEIIQPFLDGNGRIGRLLLTLLPVAWDVVSQPIFYVSSYFEKRRQAYKEALLGVIQQGNWEAWLRFFLRGIKIQSEEVVTKGRQLVELHTQYRKRYATSAKIQSLIELIFENSLINGARVVKELNVSSATAYQYLSLLENDHILREITGRKRGRRYVAQEIMDVIEGVGKDCTLEKPNIP